MGSILTLVAAASSRLEVVRGRDSIWTWQLDSPTLQPFEDPLQRADVNACLDLIDAEDSTAFERRQGAREQNRSPERITKDDEGRGPSIGGSGSWRDALLETRQSQPPESPGRSSTSSRTMSRRRSKTCRQRELTST